MKNKFNNIKKVFDTIINVAPFIMLIATIFSGIYSDTIMYGKIYSFLPDTIGYSILSNLVMVKLYFRKQYCFPTKIAVCALILMNLTSLTYAVFGESTYVIYSNVFDILVISLGFLVTLLYYFFRWKY